MFSRARLFLSAISYRPAVMLVKHRPQQGGRMAENLPAAGLYVGAPLWANPFIHPETKGLSLFSCLIYGAASCPSRGAVMRRREGGAGCGTRERGQRKATSPGGGGEPSRGTKTAGRSDRSVEGVKPELPRGAPNGETHRYSA